MDRKGEPTRGPDSDITRPFSLLVMSESGPLRKQTPNRACKEKSTTSTTIALPVPLGVVNAELRCIVNVTASVWF